MKNATNNSRIPQLEKMLEKGIDNALLRFSLGAEHHQANAHTIAAKHLEAAVALDPDYSAAWKLLGKALAANAQPERAQAAFTRGIAAAEKRGDKQAGKEMRVFRKRVEKQLQTQEKSS